MPKLSDFAAVIFDMDGLVLDTESIYRHAWQQAASLMGYNFSDDFCLSLSGLSYENVIAKILNIYSVDFNLAKFNELSGRCWYEWVNARGIAIKSGFRPLLDAVIEHKIPYCLATNSQAGYARECLAYAGLSDVFTVFVSRDDVQHAKPLPDIFLKAADRLQVKITECLALEDSYTGVMAASRAGAYVVGVPSLWPVDVRMLDHCHLMVKDLNELLETFSV
jgi:HAD superfamily hydrolase (TIGR01509 family)